jgi:chitodextrinase
LVWTQPTRDAKERVKASQGREGQGSGLATAARMFVLAGLLVGLLLLPGTKHLGTTAQAVGDPVIATAGDIACDPSNSNFNAGNGSSSSCAEKATSDLLLGIAPVAVLNLGDNQYYCGSAEAYQQSYDPSWGRLKGITHPSVGNHEFLTSGGTGCTTANQGGAGYYSYFGTAAGSPGQGYYSYDVGTWHLIALNSNCGEAGGCSATSPQGRWLENDLTTHANYCTLAYWHIPLYSSGGRANSNSKSFWTALYNHDADLVISAHDHTYERFAPQDPNGNLNLARGMREFIVGTGGANHTSFTTIFPNSEIRNSDTFGVLKLTLHPTSYDWQFAPVPGKTFTDSGTQACHGSVPDTTPPSQPQNLSANAVSPGQVNLTWSPSTDDTGVAGYNVYRDGAKIATTSTTSYTDRSVVPNRAYTYTVAAYDAVGHVSTQSSPAAVTTPPDMNPPTAPSSLLASLSQGRVALTWTGSTDDVGVTSYSILRDGAQVGSSTSTSYTDQTTAPNTTYTYTVVAFDGAGNASAPSNSVTVTTPPPVSSLTFTPGGDTYVQQDTPTTNYGSSTQMTADNSPVRHMLVKFTVSGVGSRPIVHASLQLNCLNSSGVGGTFFAVADNTWLESLVNWNTAPSASTTPIATLGRVTAGVTYDLDVTSQITGDGTYSFEATSTSTDGAYYSTKEGAVAPKLIVTLG